MTKEIIWVGLAFLLILALCIVSQAVIVDQAELVCLKLAPMEPALVAADWPAARACYQQARQAWDSTDRLWKLLINHDDMRDIEISFVDLAVLLAQEDAAKSGQELATLLFYLRHVPDNERPTLGNIF